MPLHSASYFAGVGTVVATMAIGFGGGVMLTDAFFGNSERTPTRMERRAAPLAESTPVVAAAPAPQPQPDRQQVAATPASQPPVEQQTPQPQQPQAPQQQAAAPQTVTEPQQPAQPSAPPAAQQQPRFEQSMGQMREVDLRQRDADIKKAAAERRKQERRKWAERRKRDMEKVDELTAVTDKVRQIERQREREPEQRSFAAESPPSRLLFRPFDGDDDD